MMMEFKFNEERAKNMGVTLDMCYASVDDYMQKKGVYPKKKGIYIESQDGFDTFAKARIQLPRSWWFLKVIDEWYWFDDENDIDYNDIGYDCLKSYLAGGV